MAIAASSSRIFLSSHRHISHFLLLKNPNFHSPLRHPITSLSHSIFPSLSLHQSHPKSPSIPVHSSFHFSIPYKFFNSIFLGHDYTSSRWNFAPGGKTLNNGGVGVGGGDKGPEVAVVLLGWLGSKQKHLRRYVELYNERGFHAVTFVASVRDVLSFDLGKKLEERVKRLSGELVSWLSEDNESGRERFLMFHTFSNTGWLAYGAILDNLRGRQDLFERIKGCVVDSGGDPNIDPKVWAAGFTTALLKKSSSATRASVEAEGRTQLGRGTDASKIEKEEPFLIETWLLFTFEKFFSYLLNLPDINRRLTKIISILSENQPPCPQLYLYSTGDKVIPFQSVESFIKDQKRTGKQVFSFNFGSSPHVDHYRTFPDVYTSQLHNFLKECLVMTGKL